MAMGSFDEMRVLLELSKDLEFIDKTTQEKFDKEYDEIGKMLTVLRKNWR